MDWIILISFPICLYFYYWIFRFIRDFLRDLLK